MQLGLQRYANVCREGHPGCDRPTSLSPVERLLISQAPRLEVLCCSADGLRCVPEMVLWALKELQLTVFGSWPRRLREVMRGLPNLTHFCYWSMNQHGPTPGEIRDALVDHRDTLQVLHLGLDRFALTPKGRILPRYTPYDYTIPTLSDFTQLRTLSLDLTMIYPCTDEKPVYGTLQ
ncbi:hypothetical protein B0T10DRAFT_462351 [Thelonectria olida]|uniref:Uncharacterized protein n=1 Tax=Thelonectria olida TaxID=1576542 RepID=A0A9P8W030_9HYPO|nr:hypothetical protein B0T10DRAFT_462351 [Thelonectria olida]